MEGAKLKYAKLSIEKLLEHLRPDDYLGVVEFNAGTHVVSRAERVTSEKKDAVRKAVRNLRAGGGTNFSGGMLTAIDSLKDLDLGVNYIHRVIMFTDGQPNAGPAIKAADIIKFYKANAPEYITASAFGYGQGNGDFDPDFLAEFAREGKGNYAHVQNPDNALQAFGIELGGLTSTYATNIRIRVQPLAGHAVTKVVSDVGTQDAEGSETWVTIPDLLAEETRNIVLGVKLAEQKAQGPRAVNVFETKIFYDAFDALGKKEVKTGDAKAKVRFVKAGEEKKAEGLDSIIGLAVLARTQIEAEAEAAKGNFAAAQALFDPSRFTAYGPPGVYTQVVTNLSASVASADSYTSSQGYRRSMGRGMTRGMGGSYTAEVGEELTSLGITTQNSVQTSTAGSFSGASGVILGPDGNLIAPVTPVPVKP
jgi:Ca-activated chloride channel family protein